MVAPAILIADDDASFRRVLEYYLKEAGFNVASAEDGKRALELFSQNRFHAVLTDLDMPALSGNELLRLVKQQSPDTPVIVITAFGTIDSVEHQTLLMKIQQAMQDGSSYLNPFPPLGRERGTATLHEYALIMTELPELRQP